MKQKNKKHILFRYVFIIFVILLFALGSIYKLTFTTIVHAEKWNTKAQSLLTKKEVVFPQRGNIYADNGAILATNITYYVARIDWRTQGIKESTFREALPALCDSLQAFLPKASANEWRKYLTKGFEQKKSRSFVIAGGLSANQLKRLRTFPFFNLSKNKNGFHYDSEVKRKKPFGSMASRSIGNVGQTAEEKAIHGTSGLEKALDSLLFGIPGTAHKVQLTNNITSWETVPAKRGYDIKTTIDIGIQDIAEEELLKMCTEIEARWGTVVVMEVKTGEIKAISNLVRNSKNQYVEGRNYAVLGYEPGSVMKPISMLVALEDGLVNNIDSVIVTGERYAYAGARPITDGGHGSASMKVREVIERSSNVGMAKIILRKYEHDPGTFYTRLKGLGFFEPFHSGIAGEEIPHIDSLGRRNWDRVALSRMSFGYATRIPPLSTLAVYNAIANNGVYVRPRLVKELMFDGVTDSVVPVSYIRPRICSPKNAEKLKIMLNSVVWGDRGTGRVLRDDRVNISGKTGTCYINEKGVYGTSKRYTFCGFYPYENPKYSCIVLINGGPYGAARSSGTVLKNIALKLYSRGMLDNQSDFKKDLHPEAMTTGALLVSKDPKKTQKIKSGLGVRNIKNIKAPRQPSKGVPSAIGMGLKDAIKVFEEAGLNVEFSGCGYVVSQTIKAGSPIKKGEKITIILKN